MIDGSWTDRFKRWEVRAFMLAQTPQPLIQQTGDGFPIELCWTERGARVSRRLWEERASRYLAGMYVYRVLRRG